MADAGVGSDQFLQAVDRLLPFEDGERAEILEELRAHLSDSAAAFEANGMEGEAAERAAVERLGPPERLAKELARARRDRSRLLAAAGAGAWGLIRGGVWGGIVGWVVLSVATLALTTAAALMARQTGSAWNGLAPGDGGVPNTLALGVAAFVAARLLTTTFAARAGYAARLVRWLTMPVGAMLLLAYALVIWAGPLSWPGVAALMALPVWWIAGAWRTRPLRLGFPRKVAVGVGLTLVALFVVGAVAGPIMWGSNSASVGWPVGSERIGAQAPDWALKSSNGGGSSGGYQEIWMDVPDRALLSGWTDLRIEAWRGEDPRLDGGLDQAESAPLLTAPIEWSAGGTSLDGSQNWSDGQPLPASAATITGVLCIDKYPGASFVFVVLTGLDSSGQRRLLSDLSGSRVFFSGTALDWFEAVLAGR